MALDKKYRRYATDVLTALIDKPTASGMAAGLFIPYVRYEVPYMEDRLPEPSGSYVDLVQGKIRVEEFHKGSEIHEMAYAVRDAVTAALPPRPELTVEATIEPDRKGMGYNVQFFIYSDTHREPRDLVKHLKKNRDRILSSLSEHMEAQQPAPPKADVDFNSLRQLISQMVDARMQHDHLDMAHKKPDEPRIVVDHFKFTAEAVLFSQVERYLDARTPDERAGAYKMLVKHYQSAVKATHEFDFKKEFKSKARLDNAVGVAHDYLQSINGKPIKPVPTYVMLDRRSISGQQLMEYFLDDLKVEAYQHIFKQLGVELPPPTPEHRRAG